MVVLVPMVVCLERTNVQMVAAAIPYPAAMEIANARAVVALVLSIWVLVQAMVVHPEPTNVQLVAAAVQSPAAMEIANAHAVAVLQPTILQKTLLQGQTMMLA